VSSIEPPLGRRPPHDLDAEKSVIGVCLYQPKVIADIERVVGPEDFYSLNNRLMYDAILRMWRDGETVDPILLGARLEKDGVLDQVGGTGELVSLLANAPTPSTGVRHAMRIVECGSMRRVIAAATTAADKAYMQEGDVADIIEEAVADMSAAHVTLGAVPDGVSTMDDFLDRPVEDRPEWAVPGLIRIGWRCILVAAEGVGKTVLFRQIGLAAAQGIHPLNLKPMPPCRVLIVDLENPDDSIVDVCQPITEAVHAKVDDDDYDSERAWLWHAPAGIDLRSRADRSKLETVIQHTKPDLVCLGPLYKAYSVAANENDELAAGQVMRVFDDLRTRYRFALMMEHHAPKGMGRTREMMPYGSSLWLRWPEIGLSMTAEDNDGERMSLGRWRGDRLENAWPIGLTRGSVSGSQWPWRGTWPTGTFLNENEPAPVRADLPPGSIDDDVPF